MLKIAHPIFGVTSSAKAEQFYCEKLGFRVKHLYRPDPKQLDPCWTVVIRDRVPIVLSSFQGDGPPGRNLQIYVHNIVESARSSNAPAFRRSVRYSTRTGAIWGWT